MILTLNLRANIILSQQFDVEWTLNIELCLLGVNEICFFLKNWQFLIVIFLGPYCKKRNFKVYNNF